MRQIKIRIKPQEERLDKYLSQTVKSLTRSQAKKLIKEGNISVNAAEVAPDYQIKKDDIIKIEIPQPKPITVKAQNIPLKIIYEDDQILVVDKEEGIVVHPTIDHPSGTLVNAILFHLGKIPLRGESLRPGIVHRLDKDTSGLLVVAKTQTALENLKSQFKNRQVVKKYLCLIAGKLEPAVGAIKTSIGRHPKNRKKFTILLKGKPSVTEYKVVKYLSSKKGNTYTVVEAKPKTGRTHQIRVHLSSIGHAIVGDKLYFGEGAARMFLHSSFLEFTHPKTGRIMTFTSPLPNRLVAILDKLSV